MCEIRLTETAFVWSLICMHDFMQLETSFLIKGLVALGAYMVHREGVNDEMSR